MAEWTVCLPVCKHGSPFGLTRLRVCSSAILRSGRTLCEQCALIFSLWSYFAKQIPTVIQSDDSETAPAPGPRKPRGARRASSLFSDRPKSMRALAAAAEADVEPEGAAPKPKQLQRVAQQEASLKILIP